MAHIPDLAPCGYFPASDGLQFVAVGWLEPEQDYTRGAVTQEFFLQLCMLLQRPWQPPVASCGVHPCGLCRFSGGRARSSFRDFHFDGVGSGFLFIPSGSILFVSPSSIAHYIDGHGSCPPDVFQEAVMRCPEMRSADYMRALLATPARNWLRRFREHTV